MHFRSVLSAAAFAATVIAQSSSVLFTYVPSSFTVGKEAVIKYKATGPVTILLRRGTSTDLHTVSTLTSGATGGSYTWTPEESLSSGSNYALEITSGSEVNYSKQFSVLGGSYSAPTHGTSTIPAATTSAPAYKSTGSVSTLTTSCSTSSLTKSYPAVPLSTGSSSSGSGSGSGSGASSPAAPGKAPPAVGPYGSPAKGNNTYTPPSNPNSSGTSGGSGSSTGSSPASTTTSSTGGAAALGSSALLSLAAVAAFALFN